MGFSTSGSLLIIFTGLFIAMGTLYTATANVTEELTEADHTETEQFRAAQQSTINITSAEYNETNGNLTIKVANTGETALAVDHTDVVVDGTYVPIEAFERREVEGQTSRIWRPDEQLVLEDSGTVAGFETEPSRVKVVVETGVGDVMEVTVIQ
jgi:flagellar protein FlaF